MKKQMKLPKISIVTAIYNGEQYLEGLLQSIVEQNYDNLELILIDGGSTDKSVTIIKQFNQYVSYWISEPDKGIYDAWNKGIDKATGDWIMFLGCDDILLPNALYEYAKFVNTVSSDVEYISSKVKITDQNLNLIRVKGWAWEWPRFLKEMTVAHPGSLHARKMFDKYGRFNIDYKIVGDYEFLLRPRVDLKSEYMDIITVIMREGGASDSWAAIQEHSRACILTGQSSVLSSKTNMLLTGSKFYTKKIFRSIGFNVYLRK
ncbi:glycosyltransferase family 2 protein [Spirosoma humi]